MGSLLHGKAQLPESFKILKHNRNQNFGIYFPTNVQISKSESSMILNHVFVMFQHHKNNLNILHDRTHKRKQSRQMNCFDTSSTEIIPKTDTFCENTLILAKLPLLLGRLHHLRTF